MIVLRDLTKVFYMNGQRNTVVDHVNAVFPTGVSVALLGRNGAGKSTLLKIISGTADPTSGAVLSTGTVSFPVGLASALHPDLTGAQNTRFVARIYGADTGDLMDYVEDFAELGAHFHLPIRSYSSGMKGRLSFGINMGLSFDTYLIDEVTAVGDAAFRRKSQEVFLNRMENAGAIFVSHSLGIIRDMCTAGAMLRDGQLHYFDDVEEAIERYLMSLEGGKTFVPVTESTPPPKVAFPRDARMVFGIGAAQTGLAWLADCLRRHRPCHFGPHRELHYFDVRAGENDIILKRRTKTAAGLAQRLGRESGEVQRNTVRLLGDVNNLLAIHAAPPKGPKRHDAYINYVLTGRKTQPVICDFTPSYATLGVDAFTEMAGIGGARFIFVLRDPATRVWAQIYAALPGKAHAPDACAKAARQLIAYCTEGANLSDWPEVDYAATLTQLEIAVDPSHILCLFHETLYQPQTLKTVCTFLGVPPVPEVSRPPVPKEAFPPMPDDIMIALRKLLAPQYTAAWQRFGPALPAEWASKSRPL